MDNIGARRGRRGQLWGNSRRTLLSAEIASCAGADCKKQEWACLRKPRARPGRASGAEAQPHSPDCSTICEAREGPAPPLRRSAVSDMKLSLTKTMSPLAHAVCRLRRNGASTLQTCCKCGDAMRVWFPRACRAVGFHAPSNNSCRPLRDTRSSTLAWVGGDQMGPWGASHLTQW